MRIFSYLFFSVLMCFSAIANAEMPIVFSDVSAGVFRFQVKLAQQGNPEAQYKVGEMYEAGKGVKKDLKQALSWFEKASAQGHKKSGYKLLYIEIKTKGLNDFTKTQLGVLRQEAAAGNPNAQYFLGKMYATGIGVPKSLNNSLTWLNKATFNGVPEAEHEAIAIEEELARIRENESRKRATAVAAAKKKKADEEKLQAAKKKKEDEKKRKASAAKRNSAKDAEARAKSKRMAEERKKLERERSALAAEKAKLEKEKAAAAEAKKAEDKKSSESTSFTSDPCKGKKARFLSTCR